MFICNYSAVMLNDQKYSKMSNNPASPPVFARGDAQIPFYYEVNDQYFSHN